MGANAGRLFVIGVGPGDPELLTLRAVSVLREVPCLFVPKGREEGASLALSIVRKILPLDAKEIVEAYFPMQKTRGTADAGVLATAWNETVVAVLDRLDRGIDTAFITIGDPSLYSTFFYLQDRLRQQRPAVQIEIIPGIASFTAAAALAGLPLGFGNDRLAVLPANYQEHLEETLEQFDTVVLMKVHTVFETVKALLIRTGRARHAVAVTRAGMDGERIFRDLTTVRTEDLDYFSLVIVRKG